MRSEGPSSSQLSGVGALWRRFFRRVSSAATSPSVGARDGAATPPEGTPCGSLTGRCRATVVGTLKAVHIRPRGAVPALEAEVVDGTGAVNVIWLGRREIAGVEAGAMIRAEGLVAVHDGVATMYNPKYELLTKAV